MLKHALTVVLLASAVWACRSDKPDSVPVFTCSASAPDVCWREATASADKRSPEAVAKFEIACGVEGFDRRGSACTWAGLGLSSDEPERAAALFETGCSLGVATACTQLGSSLMQSLFRADPSAPKTQKTRATAVSLLNDVCVTDGAAAEADVFGADPRALACAKVADIYQFGLGAPPQVPEALAAYEKACDLGMGYACSNGAELHLMRGGDVDAAMLAGMLRKGCDAGDPRSCPGADLLEALSGEPDGRIDRAIAAIDTHAEKLDASTGEKNIEDKEWVKERLKTMQDVDQLYRKASMYRVFLEDEERAAFETRIGERTAEVDAKFLAEFKAIIAHWGWLTISEFGPRVNDAAWLIVQHADQDVAFQKEVLAKFEKLKDEGEIAPAQYAYLYDRVAVNERRAQRFGTQGGCEDGTWQPKEVEEPDSVDERRASVGLPPLEDYKQQFAGACR